MKQLSTTALSKALGLPAKELFSKLSEFNLIVKEKDSWALTDEGFKTGAEYKESSRYGKYIVWPEVLNVDGIEIPIKSGEVTHTLLQR